MLHVAQGSDERYLQKVVYPESGMLGWSGVHCNADGAIDDQHGCSFWWGKLGKQVGGRAGLRDAGDASSIGSATSSALII